MGLLEDHQSSIESRNYVGITHELNKHIIDANLEQYLPPKELLGRVSVYLHLLATALAECEIGMPTYSPAATKC